MKITYNWLKDFINLKISPESLAEKLTLAGLEVVSLEKVKGDTVLEIEITSNRLDWLSVLGIAREVSAITQEKLKLSSQLKFSHFGNSTKSSAKDFGLKVQVEDKKDCPFYSGRIISGLKVGPSPVWLKEKLELLGCRSVNNVVDITNYILFTYGQPLHAFDLDLLSQKQVQVRRALKGEEITLIDGETKLLDPEILVIADLKKPIALAGIMGGKATEVTAQTRNILLESAIFNPVLIRRAKQKLGLQSESAYRFERGVDPQMAQLASCQAQRLICQLAGGTAQAVKFSSNLKFTSPVIKLDAQEVDKLLGLSIPVKRMVQIFNQLGLKVKALASGVLAVSIPSFRADLKLPVDLIEELARIYGYDKIPQTFPEIIPGKNITQAHDIVGGLKNILVALGLQEVITYSLIDRTLLARAQMQQPEKLVEILNPLSREQEILRPTLLPSLMRCVAFNLNQQPEKVNIFEVAHTFLAPEAGVQENLFLGLALSGSNTCLTPSGVIKDQLSLLHLKGILERLFEKLGVKDFDFLSQGHNKFDILIKGEKVGVMLGVNAGVLKEFEIKNHQVILGEVNLAKLFLYLGVERKFCALPKYPPIARDISFIMKDNILINDLVKKMQDSGGQLLRVVKVVDYYQGKQIPAGFKGFTVSCVYRAEDRTLTEAEVTPFYNATCSLLQECFGAKLR